MRSPRRPGWRILVPVLLAALDDAEEARGRGLARAGWSRLTAASLAKERPMERNLTHIALFAALIAVLGLIPKIDLPGGVPITAQSLGIMLCRTVLGSKRGALAVLLFLALALAGLPLLAGGRGGIRSVCQPDCGVFGGLSGCGLCGGTGRGTLARAGRGFGVCRSDGWRYRGALCLRYFGHGAGAEQDLGRKRACLPPRSFRVI